MLLCVLGLVNTHTVFCQSSARSAATERANFVLIFIDNVGYGDLGCYGNAEVKTPRIDKLARQGVRCTDFSVAMPSCMPSRGALMTGRHPVRTGLTEQVWQIDDLEQTVLPHRERLWPAYLKSAGYATGCFGKWNLGFAPGSRPTERGFDEYFGNISGNCDYYTHIYDGRNDLYRGTEPARTKGYMTDLIAHAACDFIQRHAREAFFCYVPFNAAHYPNFRNKSQGDPAIWQAPDAFFELYGYSPDTLNERERYRAVLSALDAGIGRVVDRIDALGLTENTIVALLSDNGAFMIPGRGLECASNRPLKAGGTHVFEGGVRVPCIVRWPQRIKARTTCGAALSSMDLMVMSLLAADVPLPRDRTLDGRDPSAALAGEAPSPHEFLTYISGNQHAIRRGRYKLLQESKSRPIHLYDLETDIGETRNLASAMPALTKELKQAYDAWYAEASAEAKN